jgi:alanine-glyoxylate transaminase/serine-glyoxylate transaminase/serine-pyruvate transaminase
MKEYLTHLEPPPRLLLGAGPSTVHSRVLRAMSPPIVGHMDPYFFRIMDDVTDMLRRVFQTSNPLTIPLSGTGTAGVEAAICNVVEPGDIVVCAVNGNFGNRAADTASRCGAIVHKVETPWGKPVGPDLSALEEELKKHRRVKAVDVVHGETSTGVLSPIPAIAELAHRYDALLIVDAVTLEPVALLFAGGSMLTFATPIEAVLQYYTVQVIG